VRGADRRMSGCRARVVVAAEALPAAGAEDPFVRYRPPYDIESDMLIAAATTATAPLRHEHPRGRFLEVGGRTPLLLWFSRVRRIWHGPAGARSCLDERDGHGYAELNVAALLRERAFFVPGIYATSDLTLAIGHRYGMPKRSVAMRFAADAQAVSAEVWHDGANTWLHARVLASGRLLAAALRLRAPWWSWPARFPSGSCIQAQVQRVPRAQLVRVEGVVTLSEPWLGEPAHLWPLGIYLPGQRMRLPAPDQP
jgi:hypothetical protein